MNRVAADVSSRHLSATTQRWLTSAATSFMVHMRSNEAVAAAPEPASDVGRSRL